MMFIDSHGLPEPLKRAIEWQESSHRPNSDISCTALIDSPLRTWLRKRYYQGIIEEYSDRLYALYGSIAHMVVERFANASGGEHAEYTTVADISGWRVSAQLDLLKRGTKLSDYKFTSVWATVDGVKEEWERQLNVGLALLGLDKSEKAVAIAAGVSQLEIVAMFRDWVPTVADKFPNKVAVLPVAVWPRERAVAYIAERVRLHQDASAKAASGEVPPICSDSERWVRDYAVMKEGRRNALKAKIKTMEEALKWKDELGGDSIRPAEPRRCMEYCLYGKQGFCPWWDCKNMATRSEPVVAPPPSTAEDPDHKRKDGSIDN